MNRIEELTKDLKLNTESVYMFKFNNPQSLEVLNLLFNKTQDVL